ncbi:MAG TPA: helix-turn-helix transcriptional regulator [Thermoanaerobaculia bacterium]|nr:helix-turn-helix transcriptional regulator [Thermoanaerobaculia bacterium]
MRREPDLAALAALIGDPARARILMALMSGVALTATELAIEANVAPSTASSHLGKLTDAHIVELEKQGRHRYFRLADADIAEVLEELTGLAAQLPGTRRGPADPALRAARVCYDHLAGERGVWLLDTLRSRNVLTGRDGSTVSSHGEAFFTRFGIDLDTLAKSRRTLCRLCLDWSERRHHLGGALGAAILDRMFALKWARRELDSRAVVFSRELDQALVDLLNA